GDDQIRTHPGDAEGGKDCLCRTAKTARTRIKATSVELAADASRAVNAAGLSYIRTWRVHTDNHLPTIDLDRLHLTEPFLTPGSRQAGKLHASVIDLERRLRFQCQSFRRRRDLQLGLVRDRFQN